MPDGLLPNNLIGSSCAVIMYATRRAERRAKPEASPGKHLFQDQGIELDWWLTHAARSVPPGLGILQADRYLRLT